MGHFILAFNMKTDLTLDVPHFKGDDKSQTSQVWICRVEVKEVEQANEIEELKEGEDFKEGQEVKQIEEVKEGEEVKNA